MPLFLPDTPCDVQRGTGRILGATVVARYAGERVSEISLAIVSGPSLKAIANVLHPYPAQAEAMKQVADMYNRTRLTPFLKRLFTLWLNLSHKDVAAALGRCAHQAKAVLGKTLASRWTGASKGGKP